MRSRPRSRLLLCRFPWRLHLRRRLTSQLLPVVPLRALQGHPPRPLPLPLQMGTGSWRLQLLLPLVLGCDLVRGSLGPNPRHNPIPLDLSHGGIKNRVPLPPRLLLFCKSSMKFPIASMLRLPTPTISLLSSMATAPSRWWPPALARRDDPLMEAWNPRVRHVPRFPHGSRHMASGTGVKRDEFKPGRRHLISSADDLVHTFHDRMISLGEQFAITQGMYNEKNRCAIEGRSGHVQPTNSEDGRKVSVNILYGDEDAGRATVGVNNGKRDAQWAIMDVDGKDDASTPTGFALRSDGKEDAREGNELGDGEEYASWAVEEDVSSYEDGCPIDYVFPMDALEGSSHRDGSIYKGTREWQTYYCTADLNETRLEAMRLSDPTEACVFRGGICMIHGTSRMAQFFSVKLAKIPVDSGLVELYGYIAVRDCLDPLRNYVVNIGRDEPIIVEQGSFIEMDGPKRGIELYGTILIEYDMKIKTGEQEKEDLQVIDGVTVIDDIGTASCHAFIGRLYGDRGAVDIIVSQLDHAVEATVEVVISEVQSNFDLYLSCFTSGLEEEIRLFHGAIDGPRALRRCVVAVVTDSWMDLKFKAGSAVASCSFKAINHGCCSQEIQILCASVSVKVTWSCI